MKYMYLASGGGVISGGTYGEAFENSGFTEKAYLIGRKLMASMIEIYEMLFNEYTILGINFSIFDLIFGTGIAVIVGIIISKWVIS